jgi:hypothetical protein
MPINLVRYFTKVFSQVKLGYSNKHKGNPMAKLKETHTALMRLKGEADRLSFEIPKTREAIVECVIDEDNVEHLLSELCRLETLQRVIADAVPRIQQRANTLRSSEKEEEAGRLREAGLRESARIRSMVKKGKVLQVDQWRNRLVLCTDGEVVVVPDADPDQLVSWGQLDSEKYRENLSRHRQNLVRLS